MLMIATIMKINMLHRSWLIGALSDLLVAQQAITLKRPQAGGLWHHNEPPRVSRRLFGLSQAATLEA